jgi:hypothetical protein
MHRPQPNRDRKGVVAFLIPASKAPTISRDKNLPLRTSHTTYCLQSILIGRSLAFNRPVTINPVSTLFPSIFQPNTSSANNTSSSSSVSSAAQQTDASGLSPTASFLNELQQLQQQSPGQFSQIAAQISSNLQTAAQAASKSGNSTTATQLSNLAAGFQNAAKGGPVPSAQDLQQAGLSGHHHHHGGGHNLSVQPSSTNPFPPTDPNSQDLLASLLGTTTTASF